MKQKRGRTGKARSAKSRLTFAGIIFITILAYLIIVILRALLNPKIDIYEVRKAFINHDKHYTGWIERKEKVVRTNKPGHILYYAPNLSKVADGDILYFSDREGEFRDLIQIEGKSGQSPSRGMRTEIGNRLNRIIEDPSSCDMNRIRNLSRYINDQTLMNVDKDRLSGLILNYNKDHHVDTVHSVSNGIFVQSVDGFEELTSDELIRNLQQDTGTFKSTDAPTDGVEADTPVGKLITDENWSVLVPVEKDSEPLKIPKEGLKVRFDADQRYGSPEVEYVTLGGQNCIAFRFNQGVIRYAEQRRLSLTVPGTTQEGLRVPRSALTGKDGKKGVFLLNNGVARFVEVQIISEERESYVVEKGGLLRADDRIVMNSSEVKEGESVYQ